MGKLLDLDGLLTNILLCIDNFKYLMAKSQYLKLIALLDQYESDQDPNIRKYVNQVRIKVNGCQTAIEMMLSRCDDIEIAYQMNSDSFDGWIFGSDVAGISTHYKIENDGMISLRVEGTLYDLPLYEQLCAIYEIGLYSKWVPFCSTSTLLKQISHVELVASLLMSTPFGISREVAVHAFGANCLQENQTIVIVTKSIDSIDGVEIPLISNSIFNDRCDVRYMYAVTTLLSPTTAKFSCVLMLDVKFRVHQMIMNWFIKQLAGAVLPLLRKQAQYISDHPEDLLYSERFAANAEFYIHFLLPEFRAFIQSRNWSQPSIGCLGYAGIPVKGADYSLPLYTAGGEGEAAAAGGGGGVIISQSQFHSQFTSLSHSSMIHRLSLQRESSIESCSTALSFFSCVQDTDPDNSFSPDHSLNKMSRPLIDDQLMKGKTEGSRTTQPVNCCGNCCCCNSKVRLLFCC